MHAIGLTIWPEEFIVIVVALLPCHILVVLRGICIGRNDHVQAMLKARLHRCIDAEVGHDAADHHIFFALFRQIFQQPAFFFERTAYDYFLLGTL